MLRIRGAGSEQRVYVYIKTRLWISASQNSATEGRKVVISSGAHEEHEWSRLT